MNKKIYKASLSEAQRLLGLINDGSHDSTHAKAVAKIAAQIGNRISYLDIELLELASWWHDVGRVYKVKHEKISAQMAMNNLLCLGAKKSLASKMYQAIINHKWNAHPKTLEGEIIRDADKLDFLSLERWQKSKNSNGQYIKSILPILPILRSILSLEISKKIYDQKIKRFKQ